MPSTTVKPEAIEYKLREEEELAFSNDTTESTTGIDQGNRGEEGVLEGALIKDVEGDVSDSEEEEDDIIILVGKNVTRRPQGFVRQAIISPLLKVNPDSNYSDAPAKKPINEEVKKLRFAHHRTAFDVDIDALEAHPWRSKTADISDYFNYGFKEATWQIYCERQLRARMEKGLGPIHHISTAQQVSGSINSGPAISIENINATAAVPSAFIPSQIALNTATHSLPSNAQAAPTVTQPNATTSILNPTAPAVPNLYPIPSSAPILPPTPVFAPPSQQAPPPVPTFTLPVNSPVQSVPLMSGMPPPPLPNMTLPFTPQHPGHGQAPPQHMPAPPPGPGHPKRPPDSSNHGFLQHQYQQHHFGLPPHMHMHSFPPGYPTHLSRGSTGPGPMMGTDGFSGQGFAGPGHPPQQGQSHFGDPSFHQGLQGHSLHLDSSSTGQSEMQRGGAQGIKANMSKYGPQPEGADGNTLQPPGQHGLGLAFGRDRDIRDKDHRNSGAALSSNPSSIAEDEDKFGRSSLRKECRVNESAVDRNDKYCSPRLSGKDSETTEDGDRDESRNEFDRRKDKNREKDKDSDNDRDRDRNDKDRDREKDRNSDRNRGRGRDRDRDEDHGSDREKDRNKDRDRDNRRDGRGQDDIDDLTRKRRR